MYTVLLVDDSAPIRLMVARLLQSKGYAVTACDSAEEALQALKHVSPDIFIVDVVMPGMDGYALVKAIRSDIRWQETPVLFLSSADTPDDRLRGYRLGAEDFIPKSSGAEEILLRMERVMQSYQRNAHGHHNKYNKKHASTIIGDLAVISPASLLNMCHNERKSGIVELTNGQQEATLWFRDGDIIHAESADLAPLVENDLVFHLIGWQTGSFTLSQQAVDVQETITDTVPALLMEAARLFDEMGYET